MEQLLQGLGFTPAEAQVYLSLLQLGQVKAGRVIRKSGLQSSTVHNALHALTEKGAASYIIKGKTRLYQAADARLLLKEYQERQERFEQLLPQLLELQKRAQDRQEAEVYEGEKGVMAMLSAMIEDAKPKDAYYFFAADVSGMNREIQEFFAGYDRRRRAKGLVVRGLARKELRPLFRGRPQIRMRYIGFPIPANISICNGRLALISWGERPTGILVRSRQLCQSQIDFFNEVWHRV
ncbi:MAG: hypothetical protein HY519_00200 [Candidatus Aenigmarchaeota archaeon]|nr:hypothetical protein [Candidatus Aenigmarchaeota archaeon]